MAHASTFMKKTLLSFYKLSISYNNVKNEVKEDKVESVKEDNAKFDTLEIGNNYN